MTSSSRTEIPSAAHAVGDVVSGFRITGVTPIDDIKALAYEAEHARTGARVLHVHCNDEENMFSVGFRTPPPDSTGVAHILEHSVLAGSERYPVKEAFNELGKRTMSTFLNAMTWPDRTIYPVCSAVRTDYFNLAAVYADLVFHPRLQQNTFRQEGHHLEFEEEDDTSSALKVTGIVYNEMKGVYSSPENLIQRQCQIALLPETPYGVDSGGDPVVIPDLTYENFVGFHRRFYSPTNARFILYGDVSLADNLAFLEGVLTPFDRVEVDSSIPMQARWDAPRAVELDYPVGTEDDLAGKAFVVLNWLIGTSADVEDSLLMDIAVAALYGSAAGPLQRALIDSGLGKDIYPRGAFEAELQETIVSFGLRGTEADQADAIQDLILGTLEKVVADGIDRELIEASFHQIEFGGKEIVPPFPIMVLVRAAPPWYFGGDPKDGLRFSTLVANVRQRWEANPRLFEDLIQSHLLDNAHRLRVIGRASNTMAAEQDAALAERLAGVKAGLAQPELDEIRDLAAALKQEQDEPDSKEAIDTLPRLDLADIPRAVRTIVDNTATLGGVEIHEHPVFSNDIGYISFGFDSRDLTNDEAALLPMTGRATTGMAAAGFTFEEMTKRMAMSTGGVGISPTTGCALRTGERFEYVGVSTKVLRRNVGAMFEVLGDLLTRPDPSDLKRLRDLLIESATRAESSIVPSGHSYAYTRAAATLGLDHYRSEQWGGISAIRALKQLSKLDSDGLDELSSRIAALQRRLFTRARVSVHVAGDPEVLDALRPHLEGFLASLPAGEPVVPTNNLIPALGDLTGIMIPAQVNYVGQVLKVPNYLDPSAPALDLLTQLVSNEYLYKKVRVQGGAYGGFGFYQKTSGILPLLSYRDPNLLETLAVYRGVLDFVRSEAINDDAVAGVRTGTIGDFDGILSPAQQLAVARSRRLLGITDEDRLKFRNGLFDVTAAEIKAMAVPMLEAAMKASPIAVLASREKLDEARKVLGDGFTVESLGD